MIELKQLWEYQQKEQELEKKEADLKNSKTRKQLLKLRNFLKKQQNDLDSFAEDVKIKNGRIDELTAEYDKNEQLLSELNTKLDGIEDLENAQSLKAEAVVIQGNLIKIRREIMDILGMLQKMDDTIRDMANKAIKAKKEYTSLKVVYDKEVEDANADIEKIREEITAAGKLVEPALLERYNEIKKNKSAPVAMIVSGQCGGCNMELPSLVLKRLKSSDKLIECENCGRILYLTAE